ncbi:hypothetical protein V1511DRAFT_520950 [Dipodascopsis uninucleata]
MLLNIKQGASRAYRVLLVQKHRTQVFVLTSLISLTIVLSIIRYKQLSSVKQDLPILLSPIPSYRHVSIYRRNPDTIFENYLESALVNFKLMYADLYQHRIWPKKIWQTAKRVDSKYEEAVASWSTVNPQYEHIIMDDESGKIFVEKAFKSIPEIVYLYNTFPNPALKANLLSYLLLYLYGGVYADIDVYCRKPIETWVSDDIWKSNADVIVGVEIDEPYADDATQKLWDWPRIYGLTQYTIVAKPFSKPVRTAILRVIAHAYTLSKMKGKNEPGKLSYYSPEDIFEVSGAGVWTDALIDTMNYKRKDISWLAFHKLSKPKRMLTEDGSIVVLPINYFGNGQRHSGSGDINQLEVCVTHLFSKSWRKQGWLF